MSIKIDYDLCGKRAWLCPIVARKLDYDLSVKKAWLWPVFVSRRPDYAVCQESLIMPCVPRKPDYMPSVARGPSCVCTYVVCLSICLLGHLSADGDRIIGSAGMVSVWFPIYTLTITFSLTPNGRGLDRLSYTWLLSKLYKIFALHFIVLRKQQVTLCWD